LSEDFFFDTGLLLQYALRCWPVLALVVDGTQLQVASALHAVSSVMALHLLLGAAELFFCWASAMPANVANTAAVATAIRPVDSLVTVFSLSNCAQC